MRKNNEVTLSDIIPQEDSKVTDLNYNANESSVQTEQQKFDPNIKPEEPSKMGQRDERENAIKTSNKSSSNSLENGLETPISSTVPEVSATCFKLKIIGRVIALIKFIPKF